MIPTASTDTIAETLFGLTLDDRLATARRLVTGHLVFTTSFGLEDQAIAHAILAQNLAIEVVTLDTGRLFQETYEVWAATEERYGRRIRPFVPERADLEALVAAQGIDGFRGSVAARKSCCDVRKVRPLHRALEGAAGWVTGLRAEQSDERAQTPLTSFDHQYGLVKINPLADWSRAEVLRYVAENAIPYNRLHDRGYPSIGCAPCTRAVQPGEPERAGRWWWEQDEKKECGLHGRTALRFTPASAAAPQGVPQ
jgi:phosphoadenosine phosphosulfate reductase